MTAPRDTWVKPPFIANPALRWAVYLGAIAYFGWVGLTMPIDWDRVAEGIGRAGKIFGGAFPPSFERSGLLIDGFLESLKIAVLATALGVLLSIPIAFMSARNVAPKPVFYLGRAIIIIARSFHPVIVAILFVKAVGFGPFAGVLTLTVYSIGFVPRCWPSGSRRSTLVRSRLCAPPVRRISRRCPTRSSLRSCRARSV